MFNSRALTALSATVAQRLEQSAAISQVKHASRLEDAILEQAAKSHEFRNSVQLRISEVEREKKAYLDIPGNNEHWEKAEQILSVALAKHQNKSTSDKN